MAYRALVLLTLLTCTDEVFGRHRAAARRTRRRPTCAPLVIAGHSEGALTGLLPAEEVRPCPAGLVLLQRQAIRLLDLVALQLHDQLVAAVRAAAAPTPGSC